MSSRLTVFGSVKVVSVHSSRPRKQARSSPALARGASASNGSSTTIARLSREARDFLPAVRRRHETLEASVDALAAEALRPLGASHEQRATVRALLDVRVWEALAERGLDHEAAERTLRALALCALQRRGRRG
jgi:hypothetical protein